MKHDITQRGRRGAGDWYVVVLADSEQYYHAAGVGWGAVRGSTGGRRRRWWGPRGRSAWPAGRGSGEMGRGITAGRGPERRIQVRDKQIIVERSMAPEIIEESGT